MATWFFFFFRLIFKCVCSQTNALIWQSVYAAGHMVCFHECLLFCILKMHFTETTVIQMKATSKFVFAFEVVAQLNEQLMYICILPRNVLSTASPVCVEPVVVGVVTVVVMLVFGLNMTINISNSWFIGQEGHVNGTLSFSFFFLKFITIKLFVWLPSNVSVLLVNY